MPFRSRALVLALVVAPSPFLAAAEGGGPCALDGTDRATTPVRACTGCHGPHGVGFALAATHPVDVDYAAAAAASTGDRALRTASTLPRDLVLVDGVVTCTTCHDARSRLPFRLARSGARALCVACHVVGEDASDPVARF